MVWPEGGTCERSDGLPSALVFGLPSFLVERALPFVTVFSGRAETNVLVAAPEVVAAAPGMTAGEAGRRSAAAGARHAARAAWCR